MFKRVTGAAPHLKERLKQQFHHHQYAPPVNTRTHKSRPHPHGPSQTTVSFSAVDNDAFEQILDDESDFMADFQSPGPQKSRPQTTGRSDIATPPKADHSDLFDTDMFVVVDKEEEGAESNGVVADHTFGGRSDDSSSPSQVVNCDPLSGQIVSDVAPGGAPGIIEGGNGMTAEIPKERTEAAEEEGESSTSSGSGGTHSEADHDPMRDNSDSEHLSDDQLFDGDLLPGEISKQASTPPTVTDPPSSSSPPSSEILVSKPVSASLSVPVSRPNDHSPLGSLPSSLEAEHQGLGGSGGSASPQPGRARLGNSGGGGDSRSRAGSYNKEPSQPHPNLDSSVSDLEAELEELLAPRTTSALPGAGSDKVTPPSSSFSLSSSPPAPISPRGNSDHHRRQHDSTTRGAEPSSMEREGSHLDSGVFEGKELESTPEREGGGGGPPDKDDLFEIHSDHFAGEGTSQTSFAAGTTAVPRHMTSGPSHLSSSPPRARHGPSSTTGRKKNSAGKTPPPRPPPASPRSQRRSTSSTRHNSASPSPLSGHVTSSSSHVTGTSPPSGHVTSSSSHVTGTSPPSGHVTSPLSHVTRTEGGVAVKLVRPLGRAKVDVKPTLVVTRKDMEGEGEGGFGDDREASEDELFPEDKKKVREPVIEEAVGQSDHTRQESLVIPPPTTTTATTTTTTTSVPRHQNHSPFLPDEEERAAGASVLERSEDRSRPHHPSETHLTMPYHLLLTLLLYLYYSLNISPYLAGLLAGTLTLYMFLGSVFIYYVHYIEREREERRQESRRAAVKVSEDFVRTMKVDFSKLKIYQVRG